MNVDKLNILKLGCMNIAVACLDIIRQLEPLVEQRGEFGPETESEWAKKILLLNSINHLKIVEDAHNELVHIPVWSAANYYRFHQARQISILYQ